METLELQDKLEDLCLNLNKESFIFDLLNIYNFPKSRISIIKKDLGNNIKEKIVKIKNKLYFKETTLEEDEHVAIDFLSKDKIVTKLNPRFIIVTDFETFLAIDTKTKETLDIKIGDLWKHYAFFGPWIGHEKTTIINENPADIKAASRMAKLFDQIIKDDSEYSKNNLHDLNIFFSRLLFCFFAEDTKIFKEGLFTTSIASHTLKDGSDLKKYLEDIFKIFNIKDSERKNISEHLNFFPYVNGGLFEKNIKLPSFGEKSREMILECGRLDWSEINPDIFGSMIQAVVHPGLRENLGMHYTSVPNIMKVIKPLFLDSLWEEFFKCDGNNKKLIALKERISKIKIFDPACGSGNFLVISYKELCKLEAEILKLLFKDKLILEFTNSISSIKLNNFYGIEIDDFAHEVARLSLYLAQHQINVMFEKEFGKLKPILPLKESGNILKENAIRINWGDFCLRKNNEEEYEIYVIGNPPYYGARKQKEPQKEDIKFVFGNSKGANNLDYIACWFYKGAEYLSSFNNIKLAFVSTNSICQGEQVSILWPKIIEKGIEIFFAYQSFKWQNNAKHNAGVVVIIIGLSNIINNKKYIYIGDKKIFSKNINTYLADGDNIFIFPRKKTLSSFPLINFGSMPNDDGNLILSKDEYDLLRIINPSSLKFIKPLIGGVEFINNEKKFCIWVEEDDLKEALTIDFIRKRIDAVKNFRLKSKREATRKLSSTPYRFAEIRYKNMQSIIIPATSSERRRYIPIGFIGKDTVSTNSINSIYIKNPNDIYIFGIVSSYMHMVWVRAIGGRLGSGLRYSSALCYNTFPFPNITKDQKQIITKQIYNILEEREKYSEKTMTELYDPEKMPEGLKLAHKFLDEVIDKIYRQKPFEDDNDRLSHLFNLYKIMIEKENNKNNQQ